MSFSQNKILSVTAALLAATVTSVAESTYTATNRQPTVEELSKLPAVTPAKADQLRKDITVPTGFDFTIFATPPAVNYPVFVSAAVDGTLYVSSDGNGSIDRKPHMGRVLRVRDTNGDGQADEVKAFVPDVDSPRGLVWDHDRLYLLHPPDIDVFIDRDHDGVADEKKTLVKGIGWTFKDRPADHGSNGLELGVDGWLYAAIGDFGFMEATGTDGRKLQLRGGGVVRVRPDGTGLELYANGTRNILEVAVSPLLDIFARDNTNDGGGWDVRLHHFTGLTQHGYPRLFKNFTGELLEPLADYGGGSGCGAGWIDEPGIPAAWNNAPFTADWGRNWIYHHGLTPKGATFTATQKEFIHLPRPTDLDVDGNAAIYASSWKGASFTWVGPDVGFIARVMPKNFKAQPMPDFASINNQQLVSTLESPSHSRRLAAQRTLLNREKIESVVPAIRSLASNKSKPLPSRVAAVFLLKQKFGTESHAFLAKLVSDPSIAPWAIRALTDRRDQLTDIPSSRIVSALKSTDPRVRREAARALEKIATPKQHKVLTPLLTDEDAVVAHTAMQALIQLKAADASLAVLDDPKASPALRTGALRVLQSLHEPTVVTGLLARLEKETNADRRAGLLTALCRLHFIEGEWHGDSWGTRPDTRGPFYQPESWSETPRIAKALRATLKNADSSEAVWIGRELARHRIPTGEAIDNLIARAANDASLIPAIAAQLAQSEDVPVSAIPLLVRAARGDDSQNATRAQAVIALAKTASPEAWRTILFALPKVRKTQTENNLAEKARDAVRHASKIDQVHTVFEEVAAELNGEESELADEILLKLSSSKVGSPEPRETSRTALDTGWTETKRRAQIIRASANSGNGSRAAQIVAALTDPDAVVADAARSAVSRLKIDPEKIRAAAAAQKIGEMTADAAMTAVENLKGDINRGAQLFTTIGCNACHTVKADEPLKGPFLGTIANVYRRRQIAEAILLPNKTIAQGFVANHFELKDGSEVDGFVVREAADAVTIRTIAAKEQTIQTGEIVKRQKQERSLMPEGLAAGMSVQEFASLLDYLESLPKAK